MNTEETKVTIKCPECSKVQQATIQHTLPWNTYIHECEECSYTIMESEWNTVGLKPPVGIVPLWRWNELRAEGLRDAIARYEAAGLTPPPEWPTELAGLRIAAVSSGGDTSVEPGPKETPELINIEALEKEGWENRLTSATGYKLYYKSGILVWFYLGKVDKVAFYSHELNGCKSMPDLRTLCKLVNG